MFLFLFQEFRSEDYADRRKKNDRADKTYSDTENDKRTKITYREERAEKKDDEADHYADSVENDPASRRLKGVADCFCRVIVLLHLDFVTPQKVDRVVNAYSDNYRRNKRRSNIERDAGESHDSEH